MGRLMHQLPLPLLLLLLLLVMSNAATVVHAMLSLLGFRPGLLQRRRRARK
jgi:hypothetical protein